MRANRAFIRRATWLFAIAAITTITSSCELTEIALATPEDVVIAEVVLREGEVLQTAFLHRTVSGPSQKVLGAAIVVTEAGTTRQFTYAMAADTICRSADGPIDPTLGTCYAAAGSSDMVRAGTRYTLRITLPDGRVLTGLTTVPGDFRMTVPAVRSCRLEVGTMLDMTWTKSAGASVYIAETRLNNIFNALRLSGVPVEGQGPLELTGLAITAADTTIVFPGEFGLFDRFEEDVHAVLIAIRQGLPPGVRAEYIVAAADHNYVNWVRGGNFNPSGLIRISSIQGSGRGVFGSLVPRDGEIRTFTGAGGQSVTPCR